MAKFNLVRGLTAILCLMSSGVLGFRFPHQWRRPKRISQTSTSSTTECTWDTMQVRKEWSALTNPERKAYSDAILCLMEKPSQLDPNLYPAALNRWLDFSVVHINRTLNIHLSGYFFTWHRHFIYLFESTLREECGFNGTQPYWDWAKWSGDLRSNPLFDGSEYSMSGDGEFNATEGPVVLGPNFTLPHGTGGGCVRNGPFKNVTTTMDPIPVSIITQGTGLPPGAFDSHPKCLQRDLNSFVASTYTNQSLLETMMAAPDITTFQRLMNGAPGTNELGVHAGGHFTLGKIGSDFFSSVQDPIFFIHHAMVDKSYADWQAREYSTRYTALTGTRTCADIPPSGNVTMDDEAPPWDTFDSARTVGDLMSITKGPYCYRYE